MALKPLGSILRKALAEKGALKRIEATLILEEFSKVIERVLGRHFVEQCSPTYFKDGVLAITCQSSVAAHGLRLNEARVICELNKILGIQVVKEVKIFR